MPIPKKYIEIKNGIPITLEYEYVEFILGGRKKIKKFAGTMNFACCDCGLVHTVSIIPHKNKMKIIMVRDNRRTGQTRRYIKYPKR